MSDKGKSKQTRHEKKRKTAIMNFLVRWETVEVNRIEILRFCQWFAFNFNER